MRALEALGWIALLVGGAIFWWRTRRRGGWHGAASPSARAGAAARTGSTRAAGSAEDIEPGRNEMNKTLRTISDIRRFFHRNERPIYFISATNFNLLGIDEWVRNFKYVSYIDCYDGRHPNVFVPNEAPHAEFESIEDINNYLLEHKEVIDHIKSRGGRPVATFLMFDEKTEALCRELGIEIWFPPAALRSRCDNKIETVRIGNKAGVPSVPNALKKVGSYEELRKVCQEAGLGHDLVIQSAFGDSGHTTFFIKSEEDWNKYAKEIVSEPEVKIMKRINCRGATLEACATRHGTLVGPLLTEVVGQKKLTPYKGGWCGNEIFPGAFTQGIRDQALDYAFKFGNELIKEGYRGYFDLDFLIDQDTGDVWLGELNPRVTGASSMTNHAAFAQADAPLFLFHLLEFSGAEYEIDVNELNARWADPEFIDDWCQLVIKHTPDTVDIVTEAPESGIWRMQPDGSLAYSRFDYHRRMVESEAEAFYLRITGEGDYRYEGADLGILIMRGRAMTDEFELNARAHKFIDGIVGKYKGKPLPSAEVEAVPAPGAFKIL